MADEKQTALAKSVFNTICTAIEEINWKYSKDEEKMLVRFEVNGEDVPMSFVLLVDVERQLIRLMSPLPFNMTEEKRVEGALATCAATYGLVDGSFDYDMSDGSIMFRMTASFKASLIGKELLQYMIYTSCRTVEEYNDQFLAINKGFLDIEEFLERNQGE